MDQVGFTRTSHLPAVFEGGKHVGTAEELEVGVGAVGANAFEQVLKSNHVRQFIGFRCLSTYLDVPFFASLYWPGFGHGKFLACISRAVSRGRNAIVFGNVGGRGGAGNSAYHRMRPGSGTQGPQGVQGRERGVPSARLQKSRGSLQTRDRS